MRRFIALAALVAVAGCGGSRMSALDGTWKVDGASITCSRLKAGSEASALWIESKNRLAQISMTFTASSKSVTASGFNRNSSATWGLIGNDIVITSNGETWPDMTVDSDRSRVHATLTKNGDTVKFDLTRP